MTNVVHVFGLGRSGTTLTHLILGNARNAFACGEIYAFFRPWRTHHFKPKCSCSKEFQNCIWRNFDNIKEHQFHTALGEVLNMEWVIDESKNLRWVIDSQRWAKRHGNKIYNIMTIKEPINQLHSFWKRGATIESFEKRYIDYFDSFLKLEIPFMTISFEELVNLPNEKIKKVCDVIGMNYIKNMEYISGEPNCHLFGSLGVRRQLEKGDFTYNPQPPHSVEFLSKADKVLKKFQKPGHLRDIYNRLKESEVKYIDRFDGAPQPTSKLLKPMYYYKNYISATYRRFRPQKWNYDQ